MADRYWVAGGTGNYNSTTNWSATSGGASGASVPTTVDDVFFNASSGAGTVVITASSNCRSLNLTGFTGTIQFDNDLVINTGATWNLGSGGYSLMGSNGIRVVGTTLTIVSNGTTWSQSLSFQNTGLTVTLSDTLNVSGDITATYSVMNGNTLNVLGNINMTGSSLLSGSTTIALIGTGIVASIVSTNVRHNITVNTAGTITMSGVLNYSNGTFTYVAGTVITTGHELRISGNTTLNTNGITWNNFVAANALVVTLTSNLNVSGTLSATNAFSINGNTVNISGTLNNAQNIAGTSLILLSGTGNWSGGGTISNPLTINTAGTITFLSNLNYSTGTLTYVAGTVVSTGFTLNITSATLNTIGINWDIISISGVITLTSDLSIIEKLIVLNNSSFSLGGNSLILNNSDLQINSGTFTMPSNLTCKSLISGVNSSATINGNILTVTENLTIISQTSGTTSIVYGGTGTWTAVSSPVGFINNNLTINTAGTLTISGTVYKNVGIITYTAGTIDDSSGTLALQSTNANISGNTFNKVLVNGVITLTSNINATTFGTFSVTNTSFTLGGNSLNFTNLELRNTGTTTLPTAWVANNVELGAASSSILNGNSITINGDFIQSGVGLYTGTTTFTYAGTGTWSRTSTGSFSNSFTINTAGTLTFAGGSIGGGIFTYTAGTVNVLTGSVLRNRATNTVFNHGNIVWYDVFFGISNNVGSVVNVTLNNQLVCSNSLTLAISNTIFGGTDGTFDTFDLYFGSNLTSVNAIQLISAKTYRVRRYLESQQSTFAFPITLRSTIVGSQAIFTLDNGSNINVGFLNATDIDSSLGRTIYSYRGVFTNTLNWQLLPTDVTPKTSIFVS
jgi:hypothetical protein